MSRQIVHKKDTERVTACSRPITKSINVAYWNSNVTCKTCLKAIRVRAKRGK